MLAVESRRVAAGIVGSLLLHAAVVLFLQSRPVPEHKAPPPVELLLVEVNLPPPPPPAPEPPKPEPVPEPPKPAPKVRPPKPAEVAKAEPPPPPAAEPPPQAEPPEPSDAPVADSPRIDVPRLDGPRRLAPSAGLTFALDAGAIAMRDDEYKGLHAPEIPKDLVGETARKTIGRGKVDRGLVHPYYSQLGKALLKTWDADRAVSQKGLKGFAENSLENTKQWNKIWMEKAEVFGKSGSPFDAPVGDRAKPLNDRLIPGQDLQARREVAREMAKQMRSSRRAEIQVTQAATGKLVKVELLKPSNDVYVDNQALVDVRAAAEKLPPPPEEAMNGREFLISTWEFELIVSISPPVPTFTFEFDEAIGFVDARLPLDRRIYKKVRLLSVD